MKAKAPGKIIFSGEHAVVHGRPALVMAVNRYVRAEAEPLDTHAIEIVFPALPMPDPLPTAALPGLQKRLQTNYQRFLSGELGIRHVLGEPGELIQYAVIHLLEETGASLDGGVRIRLESDIPIGCGMGASAAVIAATLGAMAGMLGVSPSRDNLYGWTLDVEKFQHGHPSGVDPFITVHGGLVRFQHGEAIALPPPRPGVHLALTGIPASTTGECVAHVARTFPATDPIWSQFQRVAEEMESAMRQGQWDEARAAVRANHRLLCRIDVVPRRVQSFIERVEAAGGAAKICGAGAIDGDAGGVVLMLADDETVARLSDAASYEHFQVYADVNGLT